MMEFYIHGSSFAAPFVGDTISKYIESETAHDALLTFVASRPHPFGVYAANAYLSADHMNKGESAISVYRSNKELAKQRVTKGMSSYEYQGGGPDRMTIDGVTYKIDDPTGGKVLPMDYLDRIEEFVPMPAIVSDAKDVNQ